jgi:hypothetical protein
MTLTEFKPQAVNPPFGSARRMRMTTCVGQLYLSSTNSG